MASRRKGKEPMGSSRRSSIPARLSDIPAPSFHPVDTDSTQPSSPPLVADCLGQGSNTHQSPDADINVEIPQVNLTSSATGDRILIYPRGPEFTNQTKCARKIGKIIEKMFQGPWKSYKKVPIEARDMWFREFNLSFCWRDEDAYSIRKIFDTVASNILKNRLWEAKKANQKPSWIGQSDWELLNEQWRNAHYKKVCEQNKKNRSSDCDGQGYPLHVGGSITHLTHLDKLKEKKGRDPNVDEWYLHTHSRLNADGQRVFPNDRCKNTHEKYAEKYGNSGADGEFDPPTPISAQIERWTEVVGRTKKGRVFGLAGRASKREGVMNTQGLSQREQVLTDQLAAMTQRLADVESKMARFEQFEQMITMMQNPSHFQAPHSTSMPFPTVVPPMMSPNFSTPTPHGSSGVNATFVPTNGSPPRSPHIENLDEDTD